MPAQLICMGHGGLMNVSSLLETADLDAVDGEIEKARLAIRQSPPDLVVKFGNDHNSGFSLTLMPAFLVAMRARCLGDFGTSDGAMSVNGELARALVRQLHEAGVDVATSYDALFDHGMAMALDRLFGGIDQVPVIPVFTNCGGDLRPPLKRSLALGEAVGAFCRNHCGDRTVMFIGSGGLSHDPPLPEYETSPEEVRQRMINGTQWTPELLALRTQRVTDAGRQHGLGEGDLKPLNPDWDAKMMAAFADGALESIAQQDDAAVIRLGGRGGSEIRNWLAAFAALRAYGNGPYHLAQSFYRPLPAWITGWALMRAQSA